MVTNMGPSEFRNALLENGHLVPLGADGLYAFGRTFELIVQGVDAWLLQLVSDDGGWDLRLPPLCRTEDFLLTEYLTSFPHLAGAVFGFDGYDRDPAVRRWQNSRQADWPGNIKAAGLMLISAACQPAFALFRGILPEKGQQVNLLGHCFRREPSLDPARMQAFRQREFLFLGRADAAVSFRDSWVERGLNALNDLGLDVRQTEANDPFFGRAGRLLAAHQREAGAKIELVADFYPDHDARTIALASCNLHGEHFGHAFGISCSDGATAHTSCVGFGLERIALALLRAYGPNVAGWPAYARDSVGV